MYTPSTPSLAPRAELSERRYTKYIFLEQDLFPVFYYVVEEQGYKMALFYDKELYESFDPELYKAYREYYD